MNQVTKQRSQDKQNCGCGSGGSASKHDDACCRLVCFERPKYFCGHLLTDEDLALEQRYVVEKNKLRNRTLHGNGIVCGLALSCDDDCKGQIVIGSGYAIDNCGNDLVICEARKWNVMQSLRDKQWLWSESQPDPCGDNEEDTDDCDLKQCFPIVACYSEEYSGYTTPFDAGCNSGPKECLPTRVSEKVRIDVLQEAPNERGYVETLKAKIAKCYDKFIDGPIGNTVRTNLDILKQATSGDPPSENRESYCTVFCLIRAQFLQQLRYKPDPLACSMYGDVKDLKCPGPNDESYNTDLKDVFCRLFEYILRYLYDCVLNETLLCCPEPCEESCVVLGMVEVYKGKIVRVCNAPRSYVWSFANLLPLTFQYIVTQAPKVASKPDNSLSTIPGGAGGTAEGNDPKPKTDNGCCPDPFDGVDVCGCFLSEFEQNNYGRKHAALAPMNALEAFTNRLLRSLNIVDPCSHSPRIMKGVSAEDVTRVGKLLGVDVAALQGSPLFAASDPFGALAAELLVQRGASVMAGTAEGGQQFLVAPNVSPALGFAVARGNGYQADLESHKDSMAQQLEALRHSVKELQDRLNNPPVG